MTVNKPIIIISDLDGTLLDHENYQFEAARPALEEIKQKNIPLILNSSKTAAEIIHIRETLDNYFPFVVENGAGIYLPVANNEYEIISFGKDRKEILAVLKTIRKQQNILFTGFNDMNSNELMSCTGLSEKQAVLAMQRDFTEPLQWQDNQQQWNLFCTELNKAELTFAKGGRFITVSAKVDKGQSIDWLRNYYKEQFNSSSIVIALGDSENDKEMLENADYSILVKSPAHGFPEIDADNLMRTKEYGPQGWNNSLIRLLDKLK
ncbi:MAG: HAD-IIB family hydrolase [Proteobacteria bacterium]|nr:HAD-IIB family hydrolase [Pseudomonadota bacterium]NOG60939.1 HAD-IIB family hydrolase [Pseudomonadota bacterium]